MAVFEKTYQAAKELDSSIKAAREAFRVAQKEIFATYKEPVASKKLAEAREILHQVEQRETLKALEVVKSDFASADEKIMEVVSKAAPADFPATLAAIQAKGDMTAYEANAFFKKFGDNYLAISTLLEVLHANKKYDSVHITTADMIDEKVKKLEATVLNWVHGRAGAPDDSYNSRMMTHEAHSPILMTGAEVQNFLDCNFIRE